MTKILVVDDDTENHKFAKIMLRNAPLSEQEITYVTNKEEAAKLLEHMRFDLIVMDRQLTEDGHEGEDLIKMAKQGTLNAKTAIIGWSSSLMYKDSMLSAGADAFAYKRFMGGKNPIDAFIDAVKEALIVAKGRDPDNYSFFSPSPAQRQP